MDARWISRLALALLAVSALVAPGSALARPGSSHALRAGAHLGQVRAVLVTAGPNAGKVFVELRVRHGAIRDRLVAVNHRERIDYPARIRVTAKGRGLRAAASTARIFQLHLAPGGASFSATHRLVLGPAALRAVHRGRIRLVLTVEDAANLDGRGKPEAVSLDRDVRLVPLRRSRTTPPAAAPRCEHFTHSANYSTRSEIVLVCMGSESFAIARRPRHGRVRIVSAANGRVRIAYRPSARYVGRDSVGVRTSAGGGAARASDAADVLPIVVQGFKLRALGDSVSAGFGYVGSANEMGPDQLVKCEPPDQKNDRCSANSSNGVDSPVTNLNFLPDYGLSNGVTWSAQFANSANLTKQGPYENRAVSGATPADWDTGGSLNSQLQAIVAAKPDLTVMTLGANPLLDIFLEGDGKKCGSQKDDKSFRACVQGFVDQVKLTPHLQSVLAQLLASPGNMVVISQYHVATPGLALFLYIPHQLELLTDVINDNITNVVQGSAGYGKRLLLMAPPRFNVGLGPGTVKCPGKDFTVDGPSRQSQSAQQILPYTGGAGPFCPSDEHWTINSDSGIHPSIDGYAQYASALRQVVGAYDLVPPQPGD
jgi:lysophospholipase L1-like esterase